MEATYAAAVKACGDHALLAGRAAGRLHRLFRGSPPPEVIASRGRRVRRPDEAHPHLPRRRNDPPRHPHHNRPPHHRRPGRRPQPTEPGARGPRGRGDPPGRAGRDRSGPVAPSQLAGLPRAPGGPLGRRPRHPQSPRVRVPQAPAEGRLPQPRTNERIDGRVVDCRWPKARLTVELDGYRYHHTRHAWERDRRREREARARGDEFRRYTYGDSRTQAHVRELTEPLGGRKLAG